MCNNHNTRNAFACIIPPHMIDRIIEKDSALFIQKAQNNFSLDEEIRNRRNTFSKLSNELRTVLSKSQLDNGDSKEPDVSPLMGFMSNPQAQPMAAPAQVAIAGLIREVYTAANKRTLPGKLIRKEGQAAVGNADADNVYDYAGNTYSFYQSLFGRNSIDNLGMKLIQTVHFDKNYTNAFWDGKQMIYGEGDNQTFSSFTSDIDIIAHELTHGVIQYECNLDYQDQSGALNESLADIFGIMIKQKTLNQDVKQSNWLIGENVLIGANYAIRSLKAPGTAYVNHPLLGTDPQPAHMNNFFQGSYDNGGVHLNSGIPNHAFYLAAYNVGGFAWDKVGKVWYNAMCNTTAVPSNATFVMFKDATINEAIKLFGATSNVVQEIRNAWIAVGL
jgi:Zn-dependent metalloprotease